MTHQKLCIIEAFWDEKGGQKIHPGLTHPVDYQDIETSLLFFWGGGGALYIDTVALGICHTMRHKIMYHFGIFRGKIGRWWKSTPLPDSS